MWGSPMTSRAGHHNMPKRTAWKYRELGYTSTQAHQLFEHGATPEDILTHLDFNRHAFIHTIVGYHSANAMRYHCRSSFLQRVARLTDEERELLTFFGELAHISHISIHDAVDWCYLTGLRPDMFPIFDALPTELKPNRGSLVADIFAAVAEGISLQDQHQRLAALASEGSIVVDDSHDIGVAICRYGLQLGPFRDVGSIYEIPFDDTDISEAEQVFIALAGAAAIKELHDVTQRLLSLVATHNYIALHLEHRLYELANQGAIHFRLGFSVP
jgi:hypothetical protein